MSTIDISKFYDHYKLDKNDDGTINVPCDLTITQEGVPDIVPDTVNGSCVISPTKLIKYTPDTSFKCAKSFTPFTKNITMNIQNSTINTDTYNVCVSLSSIGVGNNVNVQLNLNIKLKIITK